MRCAVLLLAFDHLNATIARSGAFADNPASLRLSEKLGYRTDGANTCARRGTAATEIRLVLEPSHFVRPKWTLRVDGLAGCRQMLGAI
jgi:RimJ/RimL family protein N-acetyltransferase